MTNIDINRSVEFVSLDTHPANNALVVTYEILVRASERASGRELARGNKRHQIQVQVSALDKLDSSEPQAGRVALSLSNLCEQIRRKCPLLANQSLEEIQLHLLYLFNRRRARLADPIGIESQQDASNSAPATSGRRQRPSSRTKGINRLSAGSERAASKLNKTATSDYGEFSANYQDVYTHQMALEREGATRTQVREDARLDSILERLDENLSNLELDVDEENESEQLSLQVNSNQIESLLGGLYGNQSERISSVATIRRLSREQDSLLALSSNRLLICATLRTLRDTQGVTGATLRLSILYCMVRFTMFQDVYERYFLAPDNSSNPNNSHSIDDSNEKFYNSPSLGLNLAELVIDILVASQQQVAAIKESGKAASQQQYEIITCSLIIIKNLLRHNRSNKLRAQILQLLLLNSHPLAKSDSFTTSLLELLTWASRSLARAIKLLTDFPDTLIYLLRLLVELLQQLSVFREFIAQLRSRKLIVAALWDSLLGLLDAIQVSRPGSGVGISLAITSKRVASDLYELELILLNLLNNLMLDRRLKLQLIRRNLLKIVLRSLVLFLASNHSALTFNRSSVLLVPFKSLYELTCHPKARSKIFESRIIIKCLFEYLQATQLIDLEKSEQREEDSSIVQDPENGKILLLESTFACDYIVCLWINISARPEAPIYSTKDAEISELLYEYLDSVFTNLHKSKSSINKLQSMYLHLKLVRNITQFMPKDRLSSTDRPNVWIGIISEVAACILNENCYSPVLVELLGSLANLLFLSEKQLELHKQRLQPENGLISLLGSLLDLLEGNKQQYYDTEQDDDLLLVSILVVGSLANSREICSQVSSLALVTRLIEASSSLLNLRPSDSELTLSALYTLTQLMSHFSFLQKLSAEQLAWELSCGQLAGELANLTSHASEQVSRLSIQLLSCLGQLEDLRKQSGERIKRIRFVAYNGKWMSAIRAASASLSHDMTTDLRITASSGDRISLTGSEQEDEDFWDETADFKQVVELDNSEQEDGKETPESELDEQRSENNHFSHLRAFSGRLRAEGVEMHKKRTILTSCIDEQEEHDLLEEEADDGDDDDDLPTDLNVIDANSMIKHLTSRREFRSLSEQQQQQQQESKPEQVVRFESEHQ